MIKRGDLIQSIRTKKMYTAMSNETRGREVLVEVEGKTTYLPVSNFKVLQKT